MSWLPGLAWRRRVQVMVLAVDAALQSSGLLHKPAMAALAPDDDTLRVAPGGSTPCSGTVILRGRGMGSVKK